MEDSNKREDELQKELSDTRAYLDIVMKELEEIKVQVHNTEPVMVPEQKRKPVFKYIAIAETVLILAGIGIFTAYRLNQDSVPVIRAQDNQLTPQVVQEVNVPVVETVKLNASLVNEVESFNMEHSAFDASVVSMFGYEYLCLSSGTLKVYYRNEFPKETSHNRWKIIVDNGTKMTEFTWKYDLNQPLQQLIPYLGSYLEDGTDQLIFPVYEPDSQVNIPKELRMVQISTLLEYDYLDINERLKDVFAITYEEKTENTGGADYTMKLAIGSTSYTYGISKDSYVNAVYYEENLIFHDDYFRLEVTENAIIIHTIAYLSSHEYLGELSAKVIVNQGEMMLGSISYGAYVNANQEDKENEGVILPRSTVLPEEHLTLWGKNRETFLLEKSYAIEHNTLLNDNFTEDENGYAYYENGVKKSLFGIDVSKYQGNIDWKTVKASGVEFAIIRVGFRGNREGTLEIDPYFEINVKEAVNAGVPIGVYFFSQAINEKEALEEAQFVLKLIQDKKITYPVIFDTEQMASKTARANDLSRQLRTDIAKVFCETIKSAGYHPMIYANTKQMIMGIDLEQLTEYDLWFAYYGSTLQFPYQFEMYQYSQEGRIAGINGAVDLNLSFIDYSKE